MALFFANWGCVAVYLHDSLEQLVSLMHTILCTTLWDCFFSLQPRFIDIGEGNSWLPCFENYYAVGKLMK